MGQRRQLAGELRRLQFLKTEETTKLPRGRHLARAFATVPLTALPSHVAPRTSVQAPSHGVLGPKPNAAGGQERSLSTADSPHTHKGPSPRCGHYPEVPHWV